LKPIELVAALHDLKPTTSETPRRCPTAHAVTVAFIFLSDCQCVAYRMANRPHIAYCSANPALTRFFRTQRLSTRTHRPA
jgi:hypothetical protein